MVFSLDWKTQCQALDRTQPCLPTKAGQPGRVTHNDTCEGAVDVCSVVKIATGGCPLRLIGLMSG